MFNFKGNCKQAVHKFHMIQVPIAWSNNRERKLLWTGIYLFKQQQNVILRST